MIFEANTPRAGLGFVKHRGQAVLEMRCLGRTVAIATRKKCDEKFRYLCKAESRICS